MSEFVDCQTTLTDGDAIVEGLLAMGFKRSEIEVHETPKHLYGYRGDQRSQKAHIIIRQQNVGPSSNDIGFERGKDGKYIAHISEYDRGAGGKHAGHTHGYNDKWLKELNGRYAEARYVKQAKKKGFEVKREVKGKKIVLTLYK